MRAIEHLAGEYKVLRENLLQCPLSTTVLAPFPCKLGAFRKRIRKVVTSKGTCRGD
jgi:hypothetical protein